MEEEAAKWLGRRAPGSSWLSNDQMKLRQEREIGNHLGVADSSLVCGIYNRVHNPLAGTRPGKRSSGHSED
ncbi:hypothetical protein ACT18_00630 [Mycolicibacter kumamotonensis]|uniref:Uncharacterized protein n=1 Tax=Mycolicibacter kumamotonensis TaxID=354243 RepID=A0A1B8SLX9_9MYCO|nr:hypothetical protein ACT18_00630 [Mycolicibacter kumamotonensis]